MRGSSPFAARPPNTEAHRDMAEHDSLPPNSNRPTQRRRCTKSAAGYTVKLDRVYGGSIPELDEQRLVYRRRWHAPPWLLLSGLFVVQVGVIRAMGASSDLRDLFVAGAATASILLGFAATLGLFFFVLPWMALDRSFMPRVRRSLVIVRAEGTAGESALFQVEIDGEALAPTSRRALFELRDELLNAHVLVIGTRALTLQAFPWGDLVDPAVEADRATKALLTCERRMRDDYGPRSLLRLLQGAIVVLDLGTDRLGAFTAPEEAQWPLMCRSTFAGEDGKTSRIQRLRRQTGVRSLFDMSLLIVVYLVTGAWHMLALFSLRGWLANVAPWPFAIVTAAVCLLPTVALLYLTAGWLYVKRLNVHAHAMIEHTPA